MAKDIVENVESKVPDMDTSSMLDALKSKELLVPAALSAVGAVAAAKGPDIVRKLTESAEQKSEAEAEKMGERAMEGATSGLSQKGGMLGKVASKALPGGGSDDGGGGGGKKTRRLPIQRWTDVAVPIDRAYQEWINFNEYPKFMHRVLNVRREDDKVKWEEKIWFSKRQWEGKITDRRKNDRIAWKTTNGTQHHGVVTFHKLDENLTRVMVDMEFEPTGMMEKMASGLRFVKRAVQADLARFKAHCEMKDAKGIDYRPTKEKDDDGNQRSQENRSQKSDGERENGRRERESRRQQRREASGSRS